MAERGSVYQGWQFGIETTPGTAVAAGKRLLMPMLTVRPVVPVTPHKGAGAKANVGVVVGREHTEASLDGLPGYNECLYLFSAHFQVPSGPTSNVFTFKPNSFGPDTIKTLSVENGSSVRAEKFNYGFVPDLQLRLTRLECNLSGQMLGRGLTEGASLTASPTVVPHVPFGPKDWKVSIGSEADLSDLTELTRCFEAEFSSRGRWAPVFAADPTQDSFVAIVERAADLAFQIQVEHDSEGSALMAPLRAGEKRFIQIEITGPEISAGVNYSLIISAPVQLIQNGRSDMDGVWGSTYDLQPVYDPDFDTSGGHLKILLGCSSTLS